ncbi:SRPBCC family protein [Roseococcus sp. SYP-B2431]|uniref:SRPBCC family protein n=1 Tax=Roseococcus sp. SYP-B2431 TaxID=2496640 RepID=UPI00103C357A|nr:SRPBCC family protein [Roseococcus sp. SYP-B2431]TCH99843.1 SRPBCC family protein [Roseococcus sp. SYP-B2431]
MNEFATPDSYGRLTEPMTLTIQRLLPGPVERIWAHLTESELRRKWLAAGEMGATPGASVEFTWRNDELNDPPSRRPEGHSAEHGMTCEIVEFEPPRRLSITWGRSGGVTFELEARGPKVLLSITHRRLPDRETLLMVGAGWHAHLDVLVARVSGAEPAPFWDAWVRLREEYARRLPG